MKKLILLILSIIIFFIIGCAEVNVEKNILIINEIRTSCKPHLCYYITSKIDFIDTCNKYQIGDTVQIIKK